MGTDTNGRKAMRHRIVPLTAAALVVAGLASTGGTSAATDDPDTDLVLVSAEALTVDGSVDTEYFIDVDAMAPWLQSDLGNKRLSQDYVYGDPRNGQFDGNEPGVTTGIHPANLSDDANLSDEIGVMENAIATWDNLKCSDLDLVEKPIDAAFPGIVRTFFQTGQLPLIQQADLTQVGFLSSTEFPYFATNPNVLGVAFTLSWVDANGNLTDIDSNGKADVAFREIYYNDQYEWADDGVLGERGSGYFDFPAVAIHEVGHGLSQAHFGNIARDGDEIIARPGAIMNAIYGGIQRDLMGTDVGGHCSNWSNWPHN
jgi:hypothetical protein